MKKVLMVLMLLVGVGLTGCGKREQTADTRQADQTKRNLAEADRQIGMPAIVNFQERKLAKMIFELRDQENMICYAYIVNKMTGKPIYLGKCIGYGLPYSVQYTNPSKIVDDPYRYQSGGKVVQQADPNGLFMPTGLSATWLMMIDPKTKKARPVYMEPEIIVSPFPLPRNK